MENSTDSIRKLKLSNPHKVILGHLNINSLRNKFESIAYVMQGTFDIFLLSETKIDESFPDKQFCLNNYRIFRRNRNRYGGEVMFYVNENLPRKSLTTEIDNLPETIFLEVNVQSSKWLFVGCYKPPSQNEEFFISNLSKTINVFSAKYDNILLMGDFNLTIAKKHLEKLLNIFNLKSLISSPPCFQSINPMCIDLILTNQEDLSSNSNTWEVGISDHHHLVSTMLNKQILKGSTKTLYYRDYKKFEENKFARDLTHELENIKKSPLQPI